MQDDRLGGARRENRPRRRPSPTTDPADPTAPGALPRTRKRLERTITDDPAHHTRETHSDTPEQLYGRGGRVRADRPPQPSCSTSSKPPPNNLQSLLRLFRSTTLLHPPLSLSHQEDPWAGRDRRDDAGKFGAKLGVRLLCAPPPLHTHPFRTIAPILAPEPSVLVRKAHCTRKKGVAEGEEA